MNKSVKQSFVDICVHFCIEIKRTLWLWNSFTKPVRCPVSNLWSCVNNGSVYLKSRETLFKKFLEIFILVKKMLNQVSVEAVYSATYVENYLDCVENLPDELQRLISRMRELDVNYLGKN